MQVENVPRRSIVPRPCETSRQPRIAEPAPPRTVAPVKLGQKLRRSYYSTRKEPELPRWTKVIPVLGLGGLALYIPTALFSGSSPPAEQQERAVERTVQLLEDPSAEDRLRLAAAGVGEPDIDDLIAVLGEHAVDVLGEDVVNRAQGSQLVPPDLDEPEPAVDGDASVADNNNTSEDIGDGDETPDGDENVTVNLAGPDGTVAVPTDALWVARSAVTGLFTGTFDTVPTAEGTEPPPVQRSWPDPYVGDPEVLSAGSDAYTISFVVDPDRDGPANARLATADVIFDGNQWVWVAP